MNDSNIETAFPSLFLQAIDFHDTIMPIALLLITFALIMRGMQGMNGDISRMWSGIISSVVIAMLIPTLPYIVNQIQLAIYSITDATGANPSETNVKFGNMIVGETDKSDLDVIDILLHERGGIGRAVMYAILSVGSFLALVIQYIFFIAQQFLTIYGIALSPVFLAMFMIESLKSIAVKYFLSLTAVLMWPLGWNLANLISNVWLEKANGSSTIFSVVAISVWLLLTTIASPLVMNKVITEGANAGGAIFQRVGTALGLGASYGVIGSGTAQISGASPSKVATTSAMAAVGGALSGATGNSGLLVPTVIGMSAAKDNMSSNETSDQPADYNAQATKISNKQSS